MISEVAVESVRREHEGIRALVRQLGAVEHDLAAGGHNGIEPVLAAIIDNMRRHLYREMRHEESQIYPLLAPVLGTEVPVRALVAEHRATRELVEGLHDLVRHPPRAWKWEDRIPAMRSKLNRLTRLLELHLRREEAAFSALLAA
ncbi:MAG TPA: hemerythrin domain-containing protein [Acidimicrobiales bacterium]|nr:hemerythrin domain-containing protein [Acidimicrobiales bacterium]